MIPLQPQAGRDSVTPDQVQSALALQKKEFSETVLQPNTLQRNVVLAGYRTEITRLEKLLAKPAKPAKARVSAVERSA